LLNNPKVGYSFTIADLFKTIHKRVPSIGVGDEGAGGMCSPKIRGKKFRAFFSGKNQVKLRNFVNFSGKNHVKFGQFVNFSYIFSGQKCRAP